MMCNIVNRDRNIAEQDSRVRNLELPTQRFTVVINQHEFNMWLRIVFMVAFTLCINVKKKTSEYKLDH